jgi:hypothetical protein
VESGYTAAFSLTVSYTTMNALDRSSHQSRAASRDASKRFSAVRLPIEEAVEDVEDAVEKLEETCSPTELCRAREHHRRAIESLQEGGYSALPEDTREDLLAHLRRNLKAVNQALASMDGGSADADSAGTSENDESLPARLRTFVRGLWSR